jgi:hypothetical protein
MFIAKTTSHNTKKNILPWRFAEANRGLFLHGLVGVQPFSSKEEKGKSLSSIDLNRKRFQLRHTCLHAAPGTCVRLLSRAAFHQQ